MDEDLIGLHKAAAVQENSSLRKLSKSFRACGCTGEKPGGINGRRRMLQEGSRRRIRLSNVRSERPELFLQQFSEPYQLRRTEFIGQIFGPVLGVPVVELLKIFLDQ